MTAPARSLRLVANQGAPVDTGRAVSAKAVAMTSAQFRELEAAMTARAAVILAAGQGTRMKSPIPKVLHKVGGRALIDHAIDAAQGAGCERIVVVVGDARAARSSAHVAARLGRGRHRHPGPAARHRPRGAGGEGGAGGLPGRRGGDLRRRRAADRRRRSSRCSICARPAPTWRCSASTPPTRRATAA